MIIKDEGNQVVHFEWDNFNRITSNILGSNFVNNTAGIIIQEIKPDFNIGSDRVLSAYDRTKGILEKVAPKTLPPVHLQNRVGPRFPENAQYSSPVSNEELQSSVQIYYTWLFARTVGGQQDLQLVPGFGGFVSATGVKPLRKSTIEYLTPIQQPFTEYSSIKELLRQSEEATLKIGQQYVFNTFDLDGCMKALPLIWKDPHEYAKHVVTPGPFHTIMNYLGMVTGQKCAGSGYGEILLEAGLVTNGCLSVVLRGKAYNKALFCFKTVSEAMERLLFEQFSVTTSVSDTIKEKLLSIGEDPSRELLHNILADDEMTEFLSSYQNYENLVRVGELGKTAQFWMSVIDQMHLIAMLLYAVKTNNLVLFHKANAVMAELFFAYDHQNYSR